MVKLRSPSLVLPTLNSLRVFQVMVPLSPSVGFCLLHPAKVKPYDINPTSSGNPLSISHISSSTAGIQCTFNGIDHSVTMVHGAQWVDVGPPQTQVTGSCQTQESDSPPAPPATPPTPPTPPAEDQVHVTFFGAADAQFSQSFPVTGELVKISTFIYTSYVTK